MIFHYLLIKKILLTKVYLQHFFIKLDPKIFFFTEICSHICYPEIRNKIAPFLLGESLSIIKKFI
ncbi:hypothetical protein ASC72_16860 [Flavobacterium sp. Root420]|nr:hypothetical protein ASC72_16860 [Flavobacterium sp. Root420]